MKSAITFWSFVSIVCLFLLFIGVGSWILAFLIPMWLLRAWWVEQGESIELQNHWRERHKNDDKLVKDWTLKDWIDFNKMKIK